MRSIRILATAAFGLSLAIGTAQAAGDSTPSPKPKPSSVDCSKKSNRNHPTCKQYRDDVHDDAVYSTAYWLAKSGKHAQALDVLRSARNQGDPRILNYTGFVTRKLGRVDEAMTYYVRALAANPNYTVARAYMGEAYLQKGDLAAAKAQLAEIESRCGATCSEHAELAREIANFEAGKS